MKAARVGPQMHHGGSALAGRFARTGFALAVLTVLAHGTFPVAHAAGPVPLAPPQGSARPTCLSLLTDAEVSAAIGRSGARAEKTEPGPGNSNCSWTWDDTGTTLTVSFADAEAIAAVAGQTKCCPDPSAPVVAQFFDHAIRMAVDLGADPPAALTGIGQRAALFFEEIFLKLVVQRPDGVAQIVGANLTREQLLAAGRSLAAP